MTMFRMTTIAAAIAIACAGCAQPPAPEAAPAPPPPAVPAAAPPPPPLVSGIDRSDADPAVRIQDDAYRAVNGHWLATAQIPPDRSATGPFERLQDQLEPRLRDLIEQPAGADAERAKLADLYASFMDETRVEQAGLAPLAPTLAAIDAIQDRAGLSRAFASLARLGVDVPFEIAVHQDAKDATRYVADLGQGGIGLPDRDYYLVTKDKRFAETREQYRLYLAKLFTLAGEPEAEDKANAVVALEIAIARIQWSRVANRDPVKTYNPVALDRLPTLAPHIDWKAWLAESGIAGRADGVVVSQPTYLRQLDGLVTRIPLVTWKAYLKAHALSDYAPYLGKSFVDARFAFVGTTLRGAPENLPRWKRGLRLVDEAMGEALGKLYVARWFPPENKARMDRLVGNLLSAYGQAIDGLDWMVPATKREAKTKLAAFTTKIGYPKTWRDYGALEIRRDDLVGNVQRARAFEDRRQIDKLGKPVDRDEWGINPQTINAYYNPELNEIVFPAAILQPPFFDVNADDAANYGAIGAVIGHEISHGFDDQGSRYDGKGNLRDWWTAADRKRFEQRTKKLIAQYDRFQPVPGYRVNGALTLGENIADNAGLSIAARAYRIALSGKPSPVIDGLTGEQRLYMGFAQIWQEKIREPALIAQLKSDPHAPGEFRANGTLANQTGFDEAFGVKAGDRMYRSPAERVQLW